LDGLKARSAPDAIGNAVNVIRIATGEMRRISVNAKHLRNLPPFGAALTRQTFDMTAFRELTPTPISVEIPC
jgi:hypothetical protein